MITYMRTDSVTLSNEALEDIRNLISNKNGADALPDAPRLFKTKSKNAQEAHEAIRPTSAGNLPEQIKSHLGSDEYRLYDLIWKRMARYFKFRYVNEVIQIMEHQTDGLTANIFAIRMRNPCGFRYYFLEEINEYALLTGRYSLFKNHSKFIRYSLHCGVGFRRQFGEVNSKSMWLISLPRGVIGWLKDKFKMAIKPPVLRSSK